MKIEIIEIGQTSICFEHTEVEKSNDARNNPDTPAECNVLNFVHNKKGFSIDFLHDLSKISGVMNKDWVYNLNEYCLKQIKNNEL
jgi:hypothetical protein